MATCKLVRFEAIEDGGRLIFGEVDTKALADDLAAFFTARGYRFEGGLPGRGRYGIGSNVLRILFGAFVKRYVFDFAIEKKEGGVELTLGKAISGAMGGVIGYQRMKKELAVILEALQAHFA